MSRSKAVETAGVEAPIDSSQSSDGLDIIAHGLATAAHDALIHVAHDRRRTVYLESRYLAFIANLAYPQVMGDLLVIRNARYCCKSGILPDGWIVSAPSRFSGHSSHAGYVSVRPSLPCTPFYRKEPDYGGLLFRLRRYGRRRIIFIVQILQLHVAKSRDADAHSFCGIQDRGSFGNFHGSSIYNKFYCFHTFNCQLSILHCLVHINGTELTSLYT